MIIDIGLNQATAFAPATVGNVAVGFDILGFALDHIGDRVTVTRSARPEVRILAINGADVALPEDPSKNTATAGLVRLIADRKLDFGFDVTIDKGIPLGSGMGGSAASAVAAIVAASALLEERLPLPDRFTYALIGEAVASGAAHGDNIAPCLLGGLTLVRSMDPPDVIRIPVPPAINCVLVHPHMRIDTRTSRGVLAAHVERAAFIEQTSNIAGFIAGCFTDDRDLIARSLRDVVIEPQRAHLIPGFAAVQKAAFAAGAMGCSISGAGPSLFAWHGPDIDPAELSAAMVKAFATVELKADAWHSSVNGLAAHLVER
ncbi:MAG: homoserine kinase [Bradymonadaceae bacterium]|nr:homoserine kinase [Lujinxingiaceae bacterium]